jgi:hypothetical protein
MGGHLLVLTHIYLSSNSSKFLRELGNVNNGRGEERFHLAQIRMWIVFIPRWPLRREELLPCCWWLVAGGGGVDEAGEASADEAEA